VHHTAYIKNLNLFCEGVESLMVEEEVVDPLEEEENLELLLGGRDFFF